MAHELFKSVALDAIDFYGSKSKRFDLKWPSEIKDDFIDNNHMKFACDTGKLFVVRRVLAPPLTTMSAQ